MNGTPRLAIRSSPSTRPFEKRRSRRLPLTLHVEIQQTDRPGRVIEKAWTQDVSTGGLRFASFNWRKLPVGGRFRVSVSVPFESVMFTDSRAVTTTATVVRWIEEEPIAGFRRQGVRRPLRRGVAMRFDEPLTFAACA